ncbi:hypothetical protein CUMW_179600 [Citrus unshiu]|uniref:Uncharacterized protein n=1 Tax=Citrus unshiu TaxID=55188 RepID=A0A2H5PYK5_CITUN|nr:hypothetical protein CUMW_179600 [Citrus unshiu]
MGGNLSFCTAKSKLTSREGRYRRGRPGGRYRRRAALIAGWFHYHDTACNFHRIHRRFVNV